MHRFCALGLALWWASPLALAQDESDDETTSTEESGEEAEADPRGPSAMRTDGLDEDSARSSFRIAQTLYTEGRPLEAAREFERAYELSRRPVLMFNAYLAFRDAGQLIDSIRCLDIYLRESEEVADRQLLVGRLAAMRQTLSEQEAEEQEQERRRLELEAERVRLAEEAEQHRQAAQEAHARADAAENKVNPIGFIVGGTGLAILAGALVTGLFANSRLGELEDNCPDNRCVFGLDVEEKTDGADTLALTTDILLGVGAATVVTGVILLFVGRGGESSDSDEAPAVSAGCTLDGCHANLQVGF